MCRLKPNSRAGQDVLGHFWLAREGRRSALTPLWRRDPGIHTRPVPWRPSCGRSTAALHDRVGSFTNRRMSNLLALMMLDLRGQSQRPALPTTSANATTPRAALAYFLAGSSSSSESVAFPYPSESSGNICSYTRQVAGARRDRPRLLIAPAAPALLPAATGSTSLRPR